MIALLGRSLAVAGIPMLHLDLSGTGDSDGKLINSTLDAWIGDLQSGINWLQKNYPQTPISIISLRMGSLLAQKLLEQNPDIEHQILWQPVLQGKLHMQQFIRLLVAGDINTDSTQRTGTAEYISQLEKQQQLEIAGYQLGARLYHEICNLEFIPDAVSTKRIDWFELVNNSDRPLLPASEKALEKLSEQKLSVSAQTITGSQFWSSQEIVDSGALITKTCEAMSNVL